MLAEAPLLWAPGHEVGSACLECLAEPGEGQCEGCGYPLCEEHSIDHPTHLTECGTGLYSVHY